MTPSIPLSVLTEAVAAISSMREAVFSLPTEQRTQVLPSQIQLSKVQGALEGYLYSAFRTPVEITEADDLTRAVHQREQGREVPQ